MIRPAHVKSLGSYFGVTELTSMEAAVRAAILANVKIRSVPESVENYLESSAIKTTVGNFFRRENDENIWCRCTEFSDDGKLRIQYDVRFLFQPGSADRKNKHAERLILDDVQVKVYVGRGYANRQAGDLLRLFFGIADGTEVTESSIARAVQKIVPIGTSERSMQRALERGFAPACADWTSRRTELTIRTMDPTMAPDWFDIRFIMQRDLLRFRWYDPLQLHRISVKRIQPLTALQPQHSGQATQLEEDLRRKRFATDTIDRAATADAINAFYRMWKQTPPEIVFCQSPFQLVVLPPILRRLALCPDTDMAALRAKLSRGIAPAFDSKSWPRIEQSLWQIVERESANGLPLLLARENYLGFQMDGHDVDSRYLNELLSRKLGYFIGTMQKFVNEGLVRDAAKELADIFRPQRWWEDMLIQRQTAAALSQQCQSTTGNGLEFDPRKSSIWWGLWDSFGLGFYSFITSYINPQFFPKPTGAQLDVWMRLQTGALGYRFFKHVCFVCDRPEQILLDNRSNLHNDNGTALTFRDGYGVHAVHGVVIPSYVIEEPDRMTIVDIENERNIEVRRIKMQQYGEARFLEKSNARIVDQSSFGTLLRKNIDNDEPLVMVRVQNSTPEPDGSYKSYYLRVPPDMNSARAAVAWTFGMTAQEYHPLQET